MSEESVLTLLKILFMVCFFILVILFGAMPLRSENFKKNPFILSIGTTFAGCLFVNVAIMHILPEAADSLE